MLNQNRNYGSVSEIIDALTDEAKRIRRSAQGASRNSMSPMRSEAAAYERCIAMLKALPAKTETDEVGVPY